MIPVMIGSKEMFVRGEAQQWTLGKMVKFGKTWKVSV